jgi:hypothetical protein
MTCMYISDELYFRESSSVTSSVEYIHTYIEQEEHEIRSMTSQVFFSFFFFLVCICTYCLTDRKFMSFFIWTGEWVIDRFDHIYIYLYMTSLAFNSNSIWLYFVSLKFTIIIIISEQIISVVNKFNYRIRDMWTLKCASTKFYPSIAFFANADWQVPLEWLRHPTDTSGYNHGRGSILFIWYLIDWTMSATSQRRRYPECVSI